MVIYKITFDGCDRFYIGSAVNFHKRQIHHRAQLKRDDHRNIHVQRCYNKYGKDSMSIEIIEEVNEKEDLLTQEQKWIDKYEFKQLLNICPTAGNTLGRTHNEESRKKISDNHADFSGENNPMYGLKGELSPNWGRKHSEETKRKISQANKGRQSMLGKKHSEETKRKMSDWQIGRKLPDSTKQKISEKRRENARHNGGEKLNWEKVCEIRRRKAEGETTTSLAKEFGISRKYCGEVINGKYWKETT